MTERSQRVRIKSRTRRETRKFRYAAGRRIATGRVHGDEGNLSQVLINLLGNAVKFSQEGEVRLKVETRDEDRVYFEVSDTGPEISEEKQDVLFEPFQQEDEGIRQGGTGLGLAIALRQVEMMGVSI